jgi:hypothetical protein
MGVKWDAAGALDCDCTKRVGIDGTGSNSTVHCTLSQRSGAFLQPLLFYELHFRNLLGFCLQTFTQCSCELARMWFSFRELFGSEMETH